MGLAPGKPIYKDLIIERLIDLKEDGTFKLNMNYFNYATGLTMINKKFEDVFGFPARNPNRDLLNEFHMNIAASTKQLLRKLF